MHLNWEDGFLKILKEKLEELTYTTLSIMVL